MIGIRGIAKKPITDATASSKDVVNGKIFYNNNGVQTGKLSNKLVLNQILLTIPKGKHEIEMFNSDSSYATYKSSVVKYTLADNSTSIMSFYNGSEHEIKGYDITCDIPITSLEYIACNDDKYRIGNPVINENHGNVSRPNLDLTNGKYKLYIYNTVIDIINGRIRRVGVFGDSSGYISSDLTISIIYHKN